MLIVNTTMPVSQMQVIKMRPDRESEGHVEKEAAATETTTSNVLVQGH